MRDDGRRTKARGACKRWSCDICRVRKEADATVEARKHLALGGTLWVMELPDTDEPEGAALRERLCDRASEARQKLPKDHDRLQMSDTSVSDGRASRCSSRRSTLVVAGNHRL